MTEPATLLAIARDLCKGKTEGHLRTAVGRAYYASFHALTQWHANLPMPGNPGAAKGEHELLIQRLLHPDKKCAPEQRKLSMWFAQQLMSMRALRVIADYKLDERVTFDQATHMCGIASSVLEKASRPAAG